MGRLDNPLPVAYQYRPLEPKPKRRLRRRAVLKFVLFLALVAIMGTLGYLVLVSEGYYHLLRYIPFSDRILNNLPSEQFIIPKDKSSLRDQDTPPPMARKERGEKFGDDLSEQPFIPEEPNPSPPPPEPKIIPLEPKPKEKEEIPPPSIIIPEPAPYEPLPKHETVPTTTTTDASPFSSILSGFLTPEMAGPLIRTILTQASDTIIGTLAEVMDTILPPDTVNRLTETLTAVANSEIPLSQALEDVFIPISQSASRLLFQYFPELGEETVDSAITFFKEGSSLIHYSDAHNIVSSASSGLTSYIAPIIGVSDVNKQQLSKLVEDFFTDILPDMDKVSMHDTSSFMPDIHKVQSSVVKLATQIASLKAQEKLVSTAFDFLTNRDKKKSSAGAADKEEGESGGGLLGNMAQQFLSSYLGGSSNQGKEADDGASALSSTPDGSEKIKVRGSKKSKKRAADTGPSVMDSFSNIMNIMGFGGDEEKKDADVTPAPASVISTPKKTDSEKTYPNGASVPQNPTKSNMGSAPGSSGHGQGGSSSYSSGRSKERRKDDDDMESVYPYMGTDRDEGGSKSSRHRSSSTAEKSKSSSGTIKKPVVSQPVRDDDDFDDFDIDRVDE